MAAIKGVPLRGAFWDGLEVPPCFRWDAFLGHDEASVVCPGAEVVYQPMDATLGQLELEALLPLLAAHTTSDQLEGVFSPFDFYEDDTFGRISDNHIINRRVFSFGLSDLLPAMINPGMPCRTPEMWRPEDRAWVAWTDWDLLGTKIFGSTTLIQELQDNPDLETLGWTPVRKHPPARHPP